MNDNLQQESVYPPDFIRPQTVEDMGTTLRN